MYARESTRKVFFIALSICLVCSAVVTISTIILRPVQETNRLHYMHTNILDVAGLLQKGILIEEQLRQLEARLVELDTGEALEVDNAEAFDARKATKDPKQSITLSPTQDIAGIKRRANNALVYLMRDDNGYINTIILPIHGYGLWSTLYGFIALKGNTSTVIGLRFYQHAETPGLGGEVNNERWLKQWQGKEIYDGGWQPTIQLIKGGVDHHDPTTIHQVDALSGATLTNRGIENIIKFWLGDDGFGPFLANVRKSGGKL